MDPAFVFCAFISYPFHWIISYRGGSNHEKWLVIGHWQLNCELHSNQSSFFDKSIVSCNAIFIVCSKGTARKFQERYYIKTRGRVPTYFSLTQHYLEKNLNRVFLNCRDSSSELIFKLDKTIIFCNINWSKRLIFNFICSQLKYAAYGCTSLTHSSLCVWCFLSKNILASLIITFLCEITLKSSLLIWNILIKAR